MRACGTSTLVLSHDLKVLVDTLGPWESEKLRSLLAKEGLHPDDINVVVGTHGHPDHIGNLNMFTKCQRHVVGFSVYSNDNYECHPFDTGEPLVLGPNLEVIPTPGHTLSCVSLIVKNVDQMGTVIVTGDLFEKEEDLNDDNIWLSAGSEDSSKQRENRHRVLEVADFVVPGHGNMFKVPES